MYREVKLCGHLISSCMDAAQRICQPRSLPCDELGRQNRKLSLEAMRGERRAFSFCRSTVSSQSWLFAHCWTSTSCLGFWRSLPSESFQFPTLPWIYNAWYSEIMVWDESHWFCALKILVEEVTMQFSRDVEVWEKSIAWKPAHVCLPKFRGKKSGLEPSQKLFLIK